MIYVLHFPNIIGKCGVVFPAPIFERPVMVVVPFFEITLCCSRIDFKSVLIFTTEIRKLNVLLMCTKQKCTSCRIEECHIQQKRKHLHKPIKKKKVLVIGHSMVNGISKKGLSRALLCKGNYFSW